MDFPNPLKAVIFDMDGVIIDSEPLHRKAYYAMFEEVGIAVTDSLFAGYTGMATLPICQDLVQRFKLTLTANELVTLKRKYFNHLFQNDANLDLIPGVRSLIEFYFEQKISLVVASSASMPNINDVFERFDLNRFFKAKLSGADLKASKPHPEIFLKAAAASGYSKEYCMVIEDSTNGILAAKAAGIYAVAFNSVHSKNQDYSLADRVIQDFEEIRFSKPS